MSKTISVPLTTDKPEDPQVRAALADIAAGNYSVAIAWLHEAQRVQQAHAAALVNVPLLRYGDPCRHGFLTYTLDGDTFHRATLGRCIDASAPADEEIHPCFYGCPDVIAHGEGAHDV